MSENAKKVWIYTTPYDSHKLTKDENFNILPTENNSVYFGLDTISDFKYFIEEETDLALILNCLAGTKPKYFADNDIIEKLKHTISNLIKSIYSHPERYYHKDINSFINTFLSIFQYKKQEYNRLLSQQNSDETELVKQK